MKVSRNDARNGCLVMSLLILFAAIPCGAADPPRAANDSARVKIVKEAYGGKPTAEALRQYPIGLFDSGTGGLTVLEQILKLDEFDNQKKRQKRLGIVRSITVYSWVRRCNSILEVVGHS